MTLVPVAMLRPGQVFRTAITERVGVVRRHVVRSYGKGGPKDEPPGTAVQLDRCGSEWGEIKILHPGVLVLAEVA